MRPIEELINIEAYLAEYIRSGKEGVGGEILMKCPFHDDQHASLSLNKNNGMWKCHVPSCEGFDGGNLLQFVARRRGISTKEAYRVILEENGLKEETRPPPPELSDTKIREYHMNLLGETQVLKTLYEKYRWIPETITKFQIGWNGKALTIPIYDEHGVLVNIRKKPLSSGHCTGIEFYNQMRLYPIQNLHNEVVYLFEGEKDAILANQHNLNALTVTSGSGSFNQEWIPLFKDKTVVIIYDIDEAGVKGAQKVKDLLLNATKELKVIALPITEPDNGDFTDYILQGKTVRELLEQIEKTAPEVKTVYRNVRIKDFVHNTTLAEAAKAEFFFSRVRFNVVVSGKDTQPFLPPSAIELTCPANQPFCKHCGLAMYGGNFTLQLDHLSQDVLQWIDCTEDHHNILIRKNMEIPLRCRLWKSFTSKAQTVEEVTLIPEIEYASHDTEYVVRSAYVMGKTIKANCSYQLEAVTMPHPTDQRATHLIYKITENKTAIDEFEMTPELQEKLRVFNVDPVQA